jgi:hypothetical protein
VVQAQRVWSWWPKGARRVICSFTTYIPLPPPGSGSYILRSPSVITLKQGWDKAHTGIDALVSLFINLDSHPAHSHNDTPEGKQALFWHQAHAREDRHRKLADFKKKAKDLSIYKNVTQHLLTSLCSTHGTFLHPPSHTSCGPPAHSSSPPTRLHMPRTLRHASTNLRPHPTIYASDTPSPTPLPLFARSLHLSIVT